MRVVPSKSSCGSSLGLLAKANASPNMLENILEICDFLLGLGVGPALVILLPLTPRMAGVLEAGVWEVWSGGEVVASHCLVRAAGLIERRSSRGSIDGFLVFLGAGDMQDSKDWRKAEK